MQSVYGAVARRKHADLSLEQLTIDDPRADEVLVKVTAVGICHTDVGMRDQTYPVPQPIVLGHEGAGIVVATGSAVRGLVAGDHVVMSFDFCGACASCNAKQPQYCHRYFDFNFAGTRDDGSVSLARGGEPVHGNFFGQSSFATYALCRERNAVKVPSDVPLEILGPLGCGVQTGAGAVINSFGMRPGESLAVFGAGTVGLSAVMAARIAGASVIVAVDVVDERLALARELGATHTVNPATQDAVGIVMEATGSGVNFAFDTTGRSNVIGTAMDVLAPRGICGIVGASAEGTRISLDAMHVMTGGRQLRGIVEGDADPKAFILQLIAWYREGCFPFDKLIRFYPFSEINTAIRDTEAGRTIKPVLRMDLQTP